MAPKSNNIVFKGKTYEIGRDKKYKSIVQVATALNVSTNDLKKYRESTNSKRIIVKPNGESLEIDLKQKKLPLILRNFGIKTFKNKDLIKDNNVITRQKKDILIQDTLATGVDLKVFIQVKFKGKISETVIEREFGFNKNYRTGGDLTIGTGEDVIPIIYDEIVKNKYKDVPFNNKPINIAIGLAQGIAGQQPDYIRYPKEVFITEVKIYRNKQGGQIIESKQSLNIRDMILREDKPPNISNLYNNVIENDNWKHCIHDFLKDVYKKHFSEETYKKLHTTNDILKFCIEKNIKMIAYDITGKCIASNYPELKSKLKNLYFIAYNNHLYPFKNQYLDENKQVIKDIQIIDNINEKIIEILKLGRYVAKASLFGGKIVSFVDNGIKYIDNPEYMKCKEILEKFGLADKIFDGIKLISLGKILKNLYVDKCDKSVFFNHSRFSKCGFVYQNDSLEGDFKTIDANKSYPSCLKDLNYLIRIDMIKDKMVDDLTLNEDHYLYIVEPEQSSILIPDTNIYTGEFLKYCKNEGLKFRILEKITTSIIDNHYKFMIEDLYKKLDEKTFKEIINPLIGTFENQTKKTLSHFKKFVNNDELQTIGENEFIETLSDNLHYVFFASEKIDIYNRKPISIQIKDESRKRVYLMMKDLKLDDTNIKSINTDSISYIGNLPNKNKLGRDLGMWKVINYKPINATFNYSNTRITIVDESINDNIFGMCYAGTGKSYKIINEHLKNLTDYIVLTPSHSSLKEYRNKKYNCSVIQKYELFDITPREQTIIIDEAGMCSRNALHLILKWHHMGKRLILYGDFNQLLPIGEETPLDSMLYKYFLFKNVEELKTNYRNNFPIEYYDKIINGKMNNIEQIIKYRIKESNNVICFRNKTCDKYNKIISKKLGIIDKFSIGAKVICNTNELGKEYDIYNKFIFTVIEDLGDKVKLDNNLIIDKKIMDKKDTHGKEYFTLAYARTLHSVQGETLDDLYFPDEDLYLVDNRFTYTLLSRLKGDIYSE